MDPRPGDRIALLVLLVEVPGALCDVSLDLQADRRDASDPHHVVGAQLEPVECLGDRLARRRQLTPAPPELTEHRPEHPDPLRLRADGHQRPGIGQPALGELLVADAEREIGIPQQAEDQLRPEHLAA